MDFSIMNYGKKTPFASFLPGIAGYKGVPLWCFYVNRGQCIASFGVENKDKSIMEFSPAHVAYQNVKRTGFRTFIRKDSEFFETFSNEKNKTEMHIFKNSLSIEEYDDRQNIETKVDYFILPEEDVCALIRKVTIVNHGERCNLEVIDGAPALLPYGLNQDNIKNMAQTSKAWMQVEDSETGVPYFRLRASLDDSAEVKFIEEGNFACGFDKDCNMLHVLVDPERVFGYDLSLGIPVEFAENGLEKVISGEMNTSNLLPSCFFSQESKVEHGGKIVFYEMFGSAKRKKTVEKFVKRIDNVFYFENKHERANELVDAITSVTYTKTGNSNFDEYIKYNYMDNVLRGGIPTKIGDNKVFYTYSRKHGDLERDYNYFVLRPEFFSQGNGNYRDVCQNRRSDAFFYGEMAKVNINTFFDAIQLDGYNPLEIGITKYKHPDFGERFTPGELWEKINERYVEQEDRRKTENAISDEFNRVMNESKGEIDISFKEGYWCDHWTYDLDLIEEYLAAFPEKEFDLLFGREYRYYNPKMEILPRFERYSETSGGVRQYNFLKENNNNQNSQWVLTNSGNKYKGTLAEKLLLLCSLKFATLDPFGMGVEMEGGKPGWYDALNGLPGMLGSSMCETYELKRLTLFLLGMIEKYQTGLDVFEELYDLVNDISAVYSSKEDSIITWNMANDAKESYRKRIYSVISGENRSFSFERIDEILKQFLVVLDKGIEKAKRYSKGIVPTYFSFSVVDYIKDGKKIIPTSFEISALPNFLEGTVHYLKLLESINEKRDVYKSVRRSDIYDKDLKMYKVNANLTEASYEIGRCRAFIPGWLENESVWLHMEYKYILEVLRAGLYEEFFEDMRNVLVPYMNYEEYGRSIFENSSFIVSSANPNKSLHKKGFVSRLSGSTAEFISIWKIMMFGATPVSYDGGELKLSFNPAIPSYLLSDKLEISCMFWGKVLVEYHFSEKKNYFPGDYLIKKYVLKYENGNRVMIEEGTLRGKTVYDIRKGLVKGIDVFIE